MKNIKEIDFNAGTILNVNKPLGLTSFSVVRKIRGWTGCRKVGHAGTLDPLAEGVLLVCTGKATKQSNELMGMTKIYEGVIKLGQFTSTDDAEGEIIRNEDVPEYSDQQIRECLLTFTGEIDQIPPMFSAIRKNGQRLYKLARQGHVVERAPRRVRIDRIDLRHYHNNELHIRVECGKGTYIRSLARDIGEKLGCGGFLKSLTRTAVGNYRIEDAWVLDDLKMAVLGLHGTI